MLTMHARTLSVVVLPIAVGCSALKVADDRVDRPSDASPDKGAPDAGAPLPSDAGGVPVLREPPLDFECRSDAWTSDTKAKAECAPRQVEVVDDEPAIDVTGISIARTPAGRVAIVYNAEVDGVGGKMRLVHFVPKAPGSTATRIERSNGDYAHAGYVARVAASAPDTLHVLAHDVEDVSQSGDVVHLRLVDGREPLTPPDLVATNVKSPSELALAVAGSGDVFVTVRVATGQEPGGGTIAKLAARTKAVGKPFSPLPDVAIGLLPSEAPGVGEASLVVDHTGQLALLFHQNDARARSTPRFHSFDGTAWSFMKTVDNRVPSGHCGYSGRLAVHDTKKYAAYFHREGQQSTPATADLRLATWTAGDDTPDVSILAQQIPSDDAAFPRYRVAMAVDAHGLLHLAIVLPGSSPDSGTLEYRRQTRVDGVTKWLSDMIDNEVLSASSGAFVDLVVDDSSRPHIAYRSGRDRKVRYATRYDR